MIPQISLIDKPISSLFLRILASSDEYLTIEQLIGELKNKYNRKIFKSRILEIIKKLNYDYFSSMNVTLFTIGNIPGNKKKEREFIEIFNTYLVKHLDLKLSPQTVFEKISKSELLLKESDNILGKITWNSPVSPNEPKFPKIEMNNGKSYHLHNDKNKIQIGTFYLIDKLTRLENEIHIRKENPFCLSVKIEDKRLDLIDKRLTEVDKEYKQGEIKKGHALISVYPVDEEADVLREEKIKIERDENYHRFHLNARGLILFIIAETKLQKKNLSTDNIISTALINLGKNFSDKFPFLLYYDQFEKYFEKINGDKYYGLNILKKVAWDLNKHLELSSEFLTFLITKMFFYDITIYFLYAMNEQLLDENSSNLKTIYEYTTKNLESLRTYLSAQMNDVETHIDYISNNYSHAEELNRGYQLPIK